MLFEVIANLSYFNQFKVNKKKIAQELEEENKIDEGLVDDRDRYDKKNLINNKENKCSC